MKIFKFNKILIIVLVFGFTLGLVGLVAVKAATTIDLGTAGDFSVLAGSGITDTAPSNIISGDVGLSPTTGAAIGIPSTEVNGVIYSVDGAGTGDIMDASRLTTAKGDLVTAYNAAATAGSATTITASSTDSFGSGTITNGNSLTPGVYNSGSTIGITGTLVLDGGGDANAVFIFQAGSSLTTATDSVVSLINGTQACNVFWQVGSDATLGTNSEFYGTIMAISSITDDGDSTIEGRLLADANDNTTGAVTLNNTTITESVCAVVPASGRTRFIAQLPPPLINVTKIPNPLALPLGPGSVTYNYIATNIGEIAMSDVWVRDDKCSSVQFISGDDNNNSLLDINEGWKYSCTKTVSETETNTVTAHGATTNGEVWDTANATVVVGIPVIPPLIHLVKKPNISLLPAGGGAVTYNYTVTNPGTVPLNNVSITDNKCTGLPGRVLSHPGDLNKNNLLESNETWSFTCQTNIIQTTTNIGTAEGHANGLTAIDFSPATVVVAPVVPKLPKTGFGSENNISWNIIIPAGIMGILISFYLARKKQTN
ncbi:MAG: ice-binding family protein [Candidatus Paceibacterota bacterium]|jgi:hypothetical protein